MPSVVLVVDDNLTLRWLFVQQLEKVGVQSDCAANGSEAVKRFKKRRGYALVLMDVTMPGVDGYDATKQIREFEQAEGLGHTPIIAITCVEDRESCIAVGMAILEKWLPKKNKS